MHGQQVFPASPVTPAVGDDSRREQTEREVLAMLEEIAIASDWTDRIAAAGGELADEIRQRHEEGESFPRSLLQKAEKVLRLIDDVPAVPAGVR